MLTSDQLQKRIGTNIRQLARTRKIALTHLADRAGVSRRHLWSVLSGARQPTIGWLVQLVNVLGCDPEDLFRRPRSTEHGKQR